MTGRALAGLVGLNLWLLVVGIAILLAVRPSRSWGEVARLSGLAYLLGVAASGVVWVWLLVVGAPLSVATILVTGLGIAACCAVVGRRLGRRLPPRPAFRAHVPRPSLVTASFAGLSVVYFEALFRSGRLAGLYEFDGWSFWVPKANAIYFYGGLDRQFFHDLPGPSYPPLVPALEAAAFRFMGSPDAVTLHLQFWFLLVGFAATVIGLLRPTVAPALLWPPVLLVLVTPHVIGYALQAQADFLLDELVAIGALLLGLWLVERHSWQLAAAALLVAAAMLTKREGVVLGACLLLAALAASWRQRRTAWRPPLLAGVAAAIATVPWRAFLAVRDLTGGGPEAGGTGLFSHLDRAWPSLKLTVSALFDFDIWLLTVPLVVLAVAVALVAGTRVVAVYAALVCLLATAGFTWIIWAFPSLPITKDAALNPIVRLSGSLVLMSAALVPWLLGSAWRGRNAVAEAR